MKSPIVTQKPRFSPIGYIAIAILIVVLAYGLLHEYRAFNSAA